MNSYIGPIPSSWNKKTKLRLRGETPSSLPLYGCLKPQNINYHWFEVVVNEVCELHAQ